MKKKSLSVYGISMKSFRILSKAVPAPVADQRNGACIMKKEKLISGDYGYINARKKRQLCIVLLWALVIGAVIGAGWIITGTRLNPATVLGIVLVLPAAKAAVGLFLIISYRSGNGRTMTPL